MYNKKNKIMEELTHSQAIGVLIQGVQIAQSKGVYTLEDAELLSRAVRLFVPEQETTEQTMDEPMDESMDEPKVSQNNTNGPV